MNDTTIESDSHDRFGLVKYNITPIISTHVLDDISLTHWGRVTHLCVGNLTIISSDNGLSPELMLEYIN